MVQKRFQSLPKSYQKSYPKNDTIKNRFWTLQETKIVSKMTLPKANMASKMGSNVFENAL